MVSLVFLTWGLVFAVAATLLVILGSACALYFVMKFLLLAPLILSFVSAELLGRKVQLCHDCNP